MTAETRIGTLDFPDHTKGDTFQAINFTVTVDSVALNLSSTDTVITMDVREGRRRITRYDTGTNGGIAITNGAAGQFQFTEKVVDLQAGVYRYDIEIAIGATDINTYVGGQWNIVQDETYD